MKNISTVVLIAILFTCIVNASAWGQITVEDFNYTPATSLNGQGGWSAHSGAGTNPPQITSGGLSYPGYASSGVGNAVSFTTSGEDNNKPYAAFPNGITSGSLYYSLMVKIDSATTTGDYFFHLNKSATIFTARIFARRAANGNIRFGIGKASTIGNINFSDSIYAPGTTHLLVVKHTVIPGATNDTVALWINPAIGGAEPTPTVFESTADRSAADVDSLYGFALRQGTAANAPIGTVDGIRVDTVWALGTSGGPLTGTKTIPGDYASLATAITDLNTLGVGTGGVTFNVAAGYTETAPDSGYIITATGSASNQITFQKSGAGTNPTFTASATLPVGALNDALIKIIGGDYITINGFTLLENPANTVTVAGTNNMTEFGVGLFYATQTNGAQNNTIKNCTITLNRTYQNTFGIYSNVRHSATDVLTVADITDPTGSNSNLSIYSNTISNVNTGICVVGSLVGANMDAGLNISDGTGLFSGSIGNAISNYGTTGTFSAYVSVNASVNGIYLNNQQNFNVSDNAIASSDGGTTAGTLRGVYVQTTGTLPTTGSFTRIINNNNISLKSAVAAGAMQGIATEGGNSTTALTISTNNFNNSTHTIAASGAITFISNTGATQSQAINNNTFTNLSVNTTGSVTFISNSVSLPTGGTQNVNGNSIVTAFNKTGAGGTVTFFTSNASSVAGSIVNNNNNNFSNITVTGATTIAGWSNTDGGSPSKNVNGNTFSNITGGTSAITIMNLNFGENNAANNTISNVTGGGAITGLLRGTSGAVNTNNLSGNTISGLSSTGAATVTGMSIGGTTGTINNVFNNKIYDLQANNAAGIVNGLTIASGTTNNVYNNLIGDLRAPATSSTSDGVRGINITSATATSNVNVSYNSVYLNGTSTGANFSTSGIFHTTSATATTATLNLRNNVIVNTSTPAGTGVTSAYRRSTTALTNYGAPSNNNDFYAGTPGASNLIFYDGTNSDQTLAAFKGRVSPREAASVAENAAFLSTTGSDPNFLHINTTIPTQLESGGVPIAGITDDFDGNTRNASTPDLGADEFTGTILDLTPPSISYTPLANTGLTTARTLTTTITDLSGVPTAGVGLPVLYWKINSGAYSGVPATSLGSNQYSFVLGAGVVSGDTIAYYIAAQDAATAPNVGVSPSGGASGLTPNPPAASTPPTSPNAYTITQPALSGDYTVGVSAFNRATGLNLHLERFTRRVMKEVEEIQEATVSNVKQDAGPQVMSQAPSRTVLKEVEEKYWALVENGKVYDGPHIFHPEGNSDNSYLAVYATITAAVADLNARGVSGATRFLLIDTAYTEAGAMTIAITNASLPTSSNTITFKPDAGVVTVISTTSGSPVFIISSPYITIDGSNTTNGTTRDMTLVNLGTAASSGVAFVTSRGVTIKNIIGKANLPTQGYAVVYSGATNGRVENCRLMRATIGVQAQSTSDSIVVVNNDIGGSSVDTTHVQNLGVSMLSTTNYVVSGNRIIGLSRPATSSVAGILVGWQGAGFPDPQPGVISNNVISDVKMTGFNGAAYAAYGIQLSSTAAASDILVVNNMVSDVYSQSDGSTSGISFTPHGIIVIQGGGYKIYYNSVNLFGLLTDPDATAVKSGAMTITAGANVGSLDIRNNIFSNSQAMSVPGAVKKSYAIYSGVANTAFTNVNNNDYYATGPDAVFGFLSADVLDLAAWRIASGQDASSVSGNPFYRDSTNLHIDSTQTPLVVSNTGTPIVGVTADFDGQTRSALTPDIGADEFSLASPALSGAYTVGAGGNYPTLDSAFAELGRIGVVGPVTFTLIDSLYRPVNHMAEGDASVTLAPATVEMDPADPLAPRRGSEGNLTDNSNIVGVTLVGPIPGASATNRVTVRPATNTIAKIVGTSTATFLFQNVSYLTFDGIGTSGATQMIVENAASGGVAFGLVGNSDNNILQNMTLRAPFTNGIAVYVDTASGAAPDSNQILNNLMPITSRGVYLRGGNYVAYGNRIIGNVIGSDSIGALGIYNQQTNGGVIANNHIQNVRDAVAAGGNIAGIWIATKQLNMQVYNNVIDGVSNRPGATAAVFAAGIYHFGTAGDSTRSMFYNNMIYGIDNPSTSATASIRGMYLSTGIQEVSVYNSVYLTGTDAGAIISGALYQSNASVGLTLKNNIGINTRVTTGAGRAMAMYFTAAPSGVTPNNNDLFVPTQAGSNVAAIGTTNYVTLAAWQATGRDSQSVSVMANFRSPYLHIDSTIATPINAGAIPFAGVIADIDGQVRNATTPDIGADEFTVVTVPPPAISTVARSTRVPAQSDSVVVTCTITDTLGITTANLLYASDGVAQTPVVMTRTSGTPTNGTYSGVIPGSANLNGKRIEYRIQANSLSGNSTTTTVTAANSYFAGLSPMSLTGVKAIGPNRALLYRNYYARVTGTVNGPNYQTTSISYFFQDAVGGLDLFKPGTLTPALALGDSIIMLGKLDQFNGLTEIVPDDASLDISVVATGRTVTPILLTMIEFNNNPELYESRLIKLTSVQRRDATPPWPNVGGSANIVVYQSVVTDTVIMRIDSDTEIDGSPEPTYPVNIIGIAGQFSTAGVFDNGYQVQPRYLTDFSAPATPGWTAQTSGITNQFYSVKALNSTTAWAAAIGGRVLRTIDGGVTWTSVGGGRIGTADIYNITAVDANTAFVTTTPSTTTYIFRTTNGGALWDTVYSLAGGFIDAIHMYDATSGIAMGDPVGGKYVILRTSNGGTTWARIATEPTPGAGEASSQNNLSVVGASNIWFGASANGRIYRSTDAGATWLSSTIPGAVAASNVIAVWFNSTQYGIASSVNGSTYTAYRSTDGGATWTAITVGTAGYNIAVSGSGTDDFWMARGTDVYRSTNRGATWTQSYTGTGTFYDVDFITSGSSTYGWGVKDNGNIVFAFFTITGVEGGERELPQAFNLMQNYPNPFNPSTTFRYALPKDAHVAMKIYNMLGQEVITLRDELQSVGFHDVVWNGRNAAGTQIASGVYFYSIVAKPADGSEAFTSIKKMLMLK